MKRYHGREFACPAAVKIVPDPRVELGTPASSGQRSTDELIRRYLSTGTDYII